MTPSRPTARLVGIDWGTSSARAYLFGDGGEVLDQSAGPWGVSRLPGTGDRSRAFADALSALTERWTQLPGSAGLPVLASGMVGSVSGWREVPYRTLPAPLLPAREELVPVTGSRGERVLLVPGLQVLGSSAGRQGPASGPAGAPDGAPGVMPGVMRGEETELVGADVDPGEIAVLPGTHSKWVHIAADRSVESFTTFLTGELFELLSTRSTLSAPRTDAAPAWAAYDEGVLLAREQAHRTTLATLFTARSRAVTGTLASTDVGDYLSGLLIAGELVASEAFGRRLPLVLIGAPALTRRYLRAALILGWTEVRTVTDAAPRGLWRTAAHLGLVPEVLSPSLT